MRPSGVPDEATQPLRVLFPQARLDPRAYIYHVGPEPCHRGPHGFGREPPRQGQEPGARDQGPRGPLTPLAALQLDGSDATRPASGRRE